jgi:hypothetical protein
MTMDASIEVSGNTTVSAPKIKASVAILLFRQFLID